ncbi:MAG: hypothetical protein HYR63_07135 [Proteobacteria bacterium]|nr:hypothetical protein [Pseudomonadota bacterium]
MVSASQSEPERAADGLRQALYALWRFGSNALVGWTESGQGIEVLTVPKIRLFAGKSAPRRVFSGERRMGRSTFAAVGRFLEAQPIELRLALPVGGGPDELSAETVERIFIAFAVTKTEQRAVFLIDIVGFSKILPEQQASQLSTLEFALNITGETARTHGVHLTMRRSTTGDGFYVWNANKGTVGDEDLFIGLILFLVFHSTLRRSVTLPEAVPVIRISAGVGSHYTYREPRLAGAESQEFIVGEVTISLARLIGATRANQILIGDFRRIDDETHQALSLEAFLERVFERLTFFSAVTMPGGRVEKIASYLTGPKRPDGSYLVQRLRVVDKHGYEHQCCNLKVNIFPTSGEPYYCGLQHEELVKLARRAS